MKTGTISLSLHGGKAPAWLFDRMVKLSREILLIIASEYGPSEILQRVSDPLWFQALGCVLGFDWHSSGVTTTVCGALKEASKGIENYIGIYIAGGKGAASRKTPSEIESVGQKHSTDLKRLVYSSRMTAKVDSNALQDGYQLYHHCFLFTPDAKNWAVVQQGMNTSSRLARRYHWLASKVSDFVCEPHSAICCNNNENGVLNLIDKESQAARATIAELSRENPKKIIKHIALINEKNATKFYMPTRHQILALDIDKKRFEKILASTYENKPKNFEAVLATPGLGPKTIRALAMISELIYGVKYSIKDPARFSFAHGGKDSIPYPVDRAAYDRSIEILHKAVKESRIERNEKITAIKRLCSFYR